MDRTDVNEGGLGTIDWRLETRNWKPETENRKPGIKNQPSHGSDDRLRNPNRRVTEPPLHSTRLGFYSIEWSMSEN